MVRKMELSGKKALGFHVNDKINEEETAYVFDAIKDKLEETDTLNLYLEVPEVKGVTAEAVWENVKFVFSHIGEYLKKVDKIAVVTDKDWLQRAAAIEDRLLPGVEEETFSFDEAERAKNWVKD